MVFLKANEERFFFQVEGAIDEFSLVRLNGAEEISSLFEFSIEVASDHSEVDFSTIIGRPALVTLLDQTDGVEELTRYIHGMVSEITLGDLGVNQSTYHLKLVPKLWSLKHRQNSRIFQFENVQQVISKVLSVAGLDADEYRFDLSKKYPEYEYCVQYREHDLDFIQRLLAEEGIHYYFEHSAEGHVLIFSDTSGSNPAISGEPLLDCFHDSQGAVREQHIFSFSYSESIVPGKVTLRDFNFKKPNMKLEASRQSELDISLEIYDHPGRFLDTGRGTHNSEIRLESLNRYRKSAKGQSDVNRLTPGYSFELTGHDRDELNVEHLIARVEHECSQPQVLEAGASTEGSQYSNKYICVPFAVPFRPATDIRSPHVQGTQTATVTGPEGEEIYTDEHGRIKVQFHWDRVGQYNENSSCWIRVSQAHAGSAFGGMFIPRIGEEVIVDFLEGDPDKPLVIGRVYHGLNRIPYKLPEHKTMSTIKTRSTMGGDGFNELRFEDKKGEEEIFIHAEKNMDLKVQNSKNERVDYNRTTSIGNDESLVVANNRTVTVDGLHDETVKKDSRSLIEGSRSLKISGDYAQKIAGAVGIDAQGDLVLQSGNKITLRVGGSFVTVHSGGVDLKGSSINLNSGGSPGDLVAPTNPAVLKAAADAGSMFVAHCPYSDAAGEA